MLSKFKRTENNLEHTVKGCKTQRKQRKPTKFVCMYKYVRMCVCVIVVHIVALLLTLLSLLL